MLIIDDIPLVVVSKHYAFKQVLISILIGLALMMTLTFVSFYHSPKLLNIYPYSFVWETFNLHLCSSFKCSYQPCRIVLFWVHLIIVVEILMANISLTPDKMNRHYWPGHFCISNISTCNFAHFWYPCFC